MLFQMEAIVDIDLEKIDPSIFKLRELSETHVLELAQSIRSNGLLQPIVVKPVSNQHFRIVLGTHRFEAVKRLGWKKIRATVKDVSDDESFLIGVTENLQRNVCISPIAEAKGYKQLISKGWTISEIALRIGKSDSYVCNRIRVLDKLHPDVQRELEFPRGNLSLGLSHAEQIASIADPQRQIELAKLTKERSYSVRQLERLMRKKGGVQTLDECLCKQCPHFSKVTRICCHVVKQF